MEEETEEVWQWLTIRETSDKGLDTTSGCFLNRRAIRVRSKHDWSVDRCTTQGDTVMEATSTRAWQARVALSGQGRRVALKAKLFGVEALFLCTLFKQGRQGAAQR
jgi:hypothetical protein